CPRVNGPIVGDPPQLDRIAGRARRRACNPPRLMAPANRLLIVSNRLPITATAGDAGVSLAQASGGLATGLRGCHQRTGGLWIGWPGVDASEPSQRSALDDQLGEHGIVAVHLTRDEVRLYYEEFSNGVLWPLFHYLLDRLPLGPSS